MVDKVKERKVVEEVVMELPQQGIRRAIVDADIEVEYIPLLEAITDIRNMLKEIKEKL